jgi:CHAD domain-containing protein
MAYRIEFAQPLGAECRRIALEQIDRALAELADDALDPHARVHAFRRRAKKIRALLRLFRRADADWYRRENAALRDLARRYSRLRDRAVALVTFECVCTHFADQIDARAFDSIRAELMGCCDPRVVEQLPALRDALMAARCRIGGWPDCDFDTGVIVSGLCKTYQRGRRALQRAERHADAVAWHTWRKRVKYLGYQWKLLRGVWPGVIDVWWHEFDRLGDLLGDDHDLAELGRRVGGHGRASSALRGLLAARSAELRGEARALGGRLYADRTRYTRARLQRWFAARSS